MRSPRFGAEVHRRSLANRGWTRVRSVVPEALLAPARDAIAAFRAAAPGEPLLGGVVPIHHPQAFWDLRQHPRVHAVFAAILGTPALWVTMDRAICRAPGVVDDTRLHWDLDPCTVSGPELQGMLFLTDAPMDGGPFVCVPSLFARLDDWLARHPEPELDPLRELDGHRAVRVTARAGDLLIWDARLPHCGGPNRSASARLSVPIRMHPEGTEEERAERVRCWAERRAPAWWRGWPGQLDPEPGEPARLTGLGRRLLGVERWGEGAVFGWDAESRRGCRRVSQRRKR